MGLHPTGPSAYCAFAFGDYLRRIIDSAPVKDDVRKARLLAYWADLQEKYLGWHTVLDKAEPGQELELAVRSYATLCKLYREYCDKEVHLTWGKED
jgi:hypothetical protein